jgi:methyl-accepting chemotaxis protein
LSGDPTLSEKVDQVAAGFDGYTKEFAKLEQAEINLGLDEKLGLSGSLRAAVHDIEAKLKDTSDPQLMSGMLTMRRHEKDFMLRRDPKYVDELNKSASAFSKAVAVSELAPAMKVDIEQKLRKYQADFGSWAKGAQDAAQHATSVSKQYSQIEPPIAEIEKAVTQRHDNAQIVEMDTRRAVDRCMLITFGFALLVVGSMAFSIGRSISKAIAGMAQSMKRLSAGDMTINVPGIGRQDEIGEMAEAVGVFKTSMIENERMRAEQAQIEQRQARQRKAEMNQLADQFETAVGEIVEGVSSASTELEASASTLTSTATAIARTRDRGCSGLGGSFRQRAIRRFGDRRAVVLGERNQPTGTGIGTHGRCGSRSGAHDEPARRRAFDRCRADRRCGRADQQHCGPDQSVGTQCDDRGGPARRAGALLWWRRRSRR